MPDGTRGGELHVLDRWMYLGSARSEEELAALAARDRHPHLMSMCIEILLRYFSNHPNLDWHDLRACKTADVH